MNNKLNSYSLTDWWKKPSRFPALIDGAKGGVYDVVYTGTPAENQTYTLRSANLGEDEVGITVRIAYPSAKSRNILKNGQIVPFNLWDEAIQNYGPIT